MILVVDGYNVLKKKVGTSFASEKQRAQFIKDLCRYAHMKRHTIVVVFDGGQSVWPEQYKPSTQVAVIYAGKKQSADDYIKQFIEEHKTHELLLVSTDRELNRCAAQLSITSIDAKPFITLVEQALEPKTAKKTMRHETLHKITENKNKELDELMSSLITTVLSKKEDEATVMLKEKMLSKKERNLLEKLKKL